MNMRTVTIIFAVLELAQAGLAILWVWQRAWLLLVLAVAGFLSMLVAHLLTGMSVLAMQVVVALKEETEGRGR